MADDEFNPREEYYIPFADQDFVVRLGRALQVMSELETGRMADEEKIFTVFRDSADYLHFYDILGGLIAMELKQDQAREDIKTYSDAFEVMLESLVNNGRDFVDAINSIPEED
jgi:hypothetical protein